MANNSGIEWTDASWNCIAGCTRASAGCDKCYAATMTRRLEAMGQKDYAGLTTKKHFNGVVRCLEHKLDIPLRWRKPRRVFVNSMSDLFHKDVPFEFIDKVFAVMAMSRGHAFQILTKRPERMAEYSTDQSRQAKVSDAARKMTGDNGMWLNNWPLKSVWLGTSVENQQTADERIPHLLRCPAAVRFLSAEPLLGPVELKTWLPLLGEIKMVSGEYARQTGCKIGDTMKVTPIGGAIDWLIVGGESGHGARPMKLRWLRSIVDQCSSAGVPCFVKQFGANIHVANDSCSEWPRDGDGWLFDERDPAWNHQGEDVRIRLNDKKGGDPAEWPEDLRIREFPRRSLEPV